MTLNRHSRRLGLTHLDPMTLVTVRPKRFETYVKTAPPLMSKLPPVM